MSLRSRVRPDSVSSRLYNIASSTPAIAGFRETKNVGAGPRPTLTGDPGRGQGPAPTRDRRFLDRRALRAALVGILISTSSAVLAEDNRANVVRLFDGHDLSHFYTFLKDRGRDSDPKSVFSVVDGLLRISGEEWGCITSRESFENYHLVAEFKWGERTWGERADRARDSGILVHSTGPDGAYSGTWMHSIECQIIEGGTGDVLVVGDGSDKFSATAPVAPEKQDTSYLYDAAGTPATIHSGRINWWGRDPSWSDTKGFRGARDLEKPTGEWNRLECIAVGRTLSVFVNGVLVNQCVDVEPRRGQIQIQSEGAEIFFREIALKKFDRN